jgi:hypothetical protein
MEDHPFNRTKRAYGRDGERVGIVDVVLAHAVALARGVDEVAGCPGPELDHERGLQVPHDRVEDFCVSGAVGTAGEFVSGAVARRIELPDVGAELLLDECHGAIGTEIYADHRPGFRPE